MLRHSWTCTEGDVVSHPHVSDGAATTYQYAAGPPAPTPIVKVVRIPPTEYRAARKSSQHTRCRSGVGRTTKGSCEALEELPLAMEGLDDISTTATTNEESVQSTCLYPSARFDLLARSARLDVEGKSIDGEVIASSYAPITTFKFQCGLISA